MEHKKYYLLNYKRKKGKREKINKLVNTVFGTCVHLMVVELYGCV